METPEIVQLARTARRSDEDLRHDIGDPLRHTREIYDEQSVTSIVTEIWDDTVGPELAKADARASVAIDALQFRANLHRWAERDALQEALEARRLQTGLDRLVPRVRTLLDRLEGLLSGWADSSPEHRAELWLRLHAQGDIVRDVLEIVAPVKIDSPQPV